MTIYLLDVNVMLALFDPQHTMHESAHSWFAATGQQSWATRPLIENGVIRIASHPNYPSSPGGPGKIIKRLRQFCQHLRHHFWTDSITLRQETIFSTGAAFSHKHITDLYLLALAIQQGGQLATFDSRIPVTAIYGGESAIAFPADQRTSRTTPALTRHPSFAKEGNPEIRLSPGKAI